MLRVFLTSFLIKYYKKNLKQIVMISGFLRSLKTSLRPLFNENSIKKSQMMLLMYMNITFRSWRICHELTPLGKTFSIHRPICRKILRNLYFINTPFLYLIDIPPCSLLPLPCKSHFTESCMTTNFKPRTL